MNVIVTVIIPAYNAANYLHETIYSVLQQTFTNYECLVVNDGSTDNTIEIVQDFNLQDSRVKLISQSNQGVASARNNGIRHAQGKFIAFLDADDLWLPDKLEAHVQHLNSSPNLGMSFGRVEFINDDKSLTGQLSNPCLREITPKRLYEENPAITPSNVVIRRFVLEQVGGFDTELSGFADAELFLRIAFYGWQVEGINRVLTHYRINLSGMSAQLYSMEAEWKRMSNKIKNYAPNLVSQHYSEAEAMLLRYLARRSLRLHLPIHVGVDFMTRSLRSDWKIILKQPRRTLLTMLAIYTQPLIRNFDLH